MFYFYLFSFLWFLRETRALFFWLYLWQLKEYHWGRFLDHFRTEKGRKLFLNPLFASKIILFLYILSLAFFPKFFADSIFVKYLNRFFVLILIFIYFLESSKGLRELFQKNLKKPIFTLKTSLLTIIILLLEITLLYFLFRKFYFDFFILNNIYGLVFWFLLFDILSPLIATFLVFSVHPFSVIFFRNLLIKKAKEKRASFKDLVVIGITGSYGKSSTKEFLTTILSEKFKVLKTKEHQNSEVGISQCILNDLKPEHEIFVCEMAAYNKGGIKLLSDIAKPKIGIVTGVNEQHLSTFGSMKNLLSAEGGEELIEALPDNGLVIFNGSNPYTLDLYFKTKKPKRIYCSQVAPDQLQPDLLAKDIIAEKESIAFKVYPKDKTPFDLKINILGAHQVSNILAAILAAKELGMSYEEIVLACQKIRPEQGTIFLKKGINGINIIDATYSANPDGVIADLDYLDIWERKKVIVMPCLIELGPASKKIHRQIGEKIAEVCHLAIITNGDRFKELKEGAMKKGLKPENILLIENPKKIFEKIKVFTQPGDSVLLEGRVPTQLLNLLIKKESI